MKVESHLNVCFTQAVGLRQFAPVSGLVQCSVRRSTLSLRCAAAPALDSGPSLKGLWPRSVRRSGGRPLASMLGCAAGRGTALPFQKIAPRRRLGVPTLKVQRECQRVDTCGTALNPNPSACVILLWR